MPIHIEKMDLTKLDTLESELNKLYESQISSTVELEEWLRIQTELYDAIEESLIGHYIEFQQYSTDEKIKKIVEHDQSNVQPLLKRYKHKLDQKLLQCPFVTELDIDYYGRFIKSKENAMRLFSEENIEIEVKEDQLVNRYFELTGGLTVTWNEEEITINEAFRHTQNPDRDTRKQAMTKIYAEFEKIEDELQNIMSELIALRDKKAKNTGFDNFRDYMFAKYERFNYTPEDCKTLADAVAKSIVPVKERIDHEHKKELGVDTYRPWDVRADGENLKPLEPFDTINELIEGTANIFQQLDPQFSNLLTTMNEKGALDLDSRKGKAPGGFCEYLPASQMSFIFMNAAKTHRDLIVLLHEMGHCIHDYLKKDISLAKYRDLPMESAELASMSVELMTMDKWDTFYKNEEDLKRAKRDQIKGVIKLAPGGVLIDQFQHWLYENPNHTALERKKKFKELASKFESGVINREGYEKWMENQWLMVLHIFEVPFYYIEYVIAQLGAVQMYMNYKKDPEQTLENYKKALSLGSTKSLSEVYEAAGIRFDFSEEKIKELMIFLQEELAHLQK